MIGSVTLAVSFFIQLAILCISTAAQIGSWRSTRRVLSPRFGEVSKVSTQVAAIFGPDGRLYVTLRRRGTVLALPASLDDQGMALPPDRVVPFPRGIGFGLDGRFYLSSGIGPGGEGKNTIAVLSQDGAAPIEAHRVEDPESSPLDMTVAPNGSLVVNSEWPFGAPRAHATVREYDPSSGRLVRVQSPDPSSGLRSTPWTSDDRLYGVGKDHVVAYEFSTR
jgi:hypothetical protein